MRSLPAALLAVLALALAVGGGAASAWLSLSVPARDRPGWTPSAQLAPPLLQGFELRQPFALPLERNEGAAFTATLDAGGRRLRAACDYRVAGVFPSSQLWTLVATERGDPAAASALHSLETLRQPDGSEAVTVSPRPSPGNWLPLMARGEFSLTLSLYGGTLGDGSGLSAPGLPGIETLRCDE